MRIARSVENYDTTTDQRHKLFYLLRVPGEPDCWKFGETTNRANRLRFYSQLHLQELEQFDYEWDVPDLLSDKAVHHMLRGVAVQLGGKKHSKEIFRGNGDDIAAVITSAVEQAWDEANLGYGRGDDSFNGQTLTMADLSALDDSEWGSIEIDHPMSNDLVDHVLNRLKPEMAEAA